jgi:predicted metal-dependent phosphoesterase TrpH
LTFISIPVFQTAPTQWKVAQRARQLGIGIAITDHNAIDGAVEIDSYDDVFSIPGIEVTSMEGTHVLVYFYRIDDLKDFYANDVKPHMGPTVMSSIGLDVESIVQRARKYNSVVIFPHPYSAAFTGICNHSFSECAAGPFAADGRWCGSDQFRESKALEYEKRAAGV